MLAKRTRRTEPRKKKGSSFHGRMQPITASNTREGNGNSHSSGFIVFDFEEGRTSEEA
jgi:hypothetical protein